MLWIALVHVSCCPHRETITIAEKDLSDVTQVIQLLLYTHKKKVGTTRKVHENVGTHVAEMTL